MNISMQIAEDGDNFLMLLSLERSLNNISHIRAIAHQLQDIKDQCIKCKKALSSLDHIMHLLSLLESEIRSNQELVDKHIATR